MGVVFAYFTWRRAGSTSTPLKIYDFSSITVRRGMEAKSNVIEINIPNKFSKYSGKSGSQYIEFREEDEINVYAHWGLIVEASHQLLAGTVKELRYRSSGNRREVTLVCMDRTYALLNKMYFGSFDDADGLTAPQAINAIVKQVSESENRTQTITTTNVETSPTKKASDPAGAATFIDVNLALDSKSAYEWILALSQDPHTRYTLAGHGATEYKSDRAFIFYVDNNNNFYWKYPSQTASSSINLTNPSLIITNIDMDKTTFDVINMIIFNAGKDPAGNGIEWYFYDNTSKQPELRIRVQPMTDIARDMQAKEKKNTAFTGEYPTSYPYTTTWGESVANNSAYLGTIGLADADGTGFRGEAVKRAKAEAGKITRRSGNLRWKGSIAMKGSSSYNVGDLLSITWDDAGMTNQLLRCIGVEHQIAKGGWFTTLELEEDAKAIAGDT